MKQWKEVTRIAVSGTSHIKHTGLFLLEVFYARHNIISSLVDVAPRQLVNRYRCHGWSQHLHLQGQTCSVIRHVEWQMFFDVSEDFSAFETSMEVYHSRRCNIPEDVNSALYTNLHAIQFYFLFMKCRKYGEGEILVS